MIQALVMMTLSCKLFDFYIFFQCLLLQVTRPELKIRGTEIITLHANSFYTD